jgi:acyl-CoA dehydrogenase
LRFVLFPLGKRFAPPTDRVANQIARAISEGGAMREVLSEGTFVPEDGPGLGWLEQAYAAALEARKVDKLVREAVKSKQLAKKPAATLHARALDAGIITQAQLETVRRADELRDRSVAVDSFEFSSYAQQIAS